VKQWRIWAELCPSIGSGAGGHRPPNDGVGGHHALWAPPTLTPVDRNKTYCFHKLVLNLPALLDIQWPKCFQLQGGFAPLTRGSAPGPRWGLCPQNPRYRLVLRTRHGAPPPETPSAAYVSKWLICDETSIDYVANNWRHQMCSYYCTDFDIDITIFNVDKYRISDIVSKTKNRHWSTSKAEPYLCKRWRNLWFYVLRSCFFR